MLTRKPRRARGQRRPRADLRRCEPPRGGPHPLHVATTAASPPGNPAAGEDDFICNWMGNYAWTLNMTWPGQPAYAAAANVSWAVGGTLAGFAQSAANFTFVKVRARAAAAVAAGLCLGGGLKKKSFIFNIFFFKTKKNQTHQHTNRPARRGPQVLNVGHMVPMNQPANALDMMLRFLRNQPCD
jgi:hypothetical protein